MTYKEAGRIYDEVRLASPDVRYAALSRLNATIRDEGLIVTREDCPYPHDLKRVFLRLLARAEQNSKAEMLDA